MRRSHVAFVLILTLTPHLPAAAHCAPDLTALQYPSAVLEQRVQGFVDVRFTVGPDRTATAFESRSAKLVEVTIVDPAWTFSRRGRMIHKIRLWTSRLRVW